VIRYFGGEWQYELARYTKAYEYSRPMGLRVQSAQIESDGSVYLLLPKSQQPAKDLPPQPDGFPLKPKHFKQ